MSQLHDCLPVKQTKSVLKLASCKSIKSLIESSFQVANKVTEKKDKKTGRRLSELAFAVENNETSDEEGEAKKPSRGIEGNLSSSITLAQFKKLQSRRKIKVVAVFPDLEGPLVALSHLAEICEKLDTELRGIKFENLDFGEYNVLNMFYNADVCVVDMSVLSEQASLFYHLGVRESTGMKDNIVVVEDHEVGDKTTSLKVRKFYINVM